MYIIFVAIDNWHLANGIHCPSTNIYPWFPNDTEDEYFSRIGRELVRLGYKTYKHVDIDKEYIMSRLDKDGYCEIPIIYPREGYVTVYKYC